MLEKSSELGYTVWACRCDGIGRRDGLKIRWWQHRVGSSPTTGTTKEVTFVYQKLLLFFIQAAGLAYHQPRRGCISSIALRWYIITAKPCIDPPAAWWDATLCVMQSSPMMWGKNALHQLSLICKMTWFVIHLAKRRANYEPPYDRRITKYSL